MLRFKILAVIIVITSILLLGLFSAFNSTSAMTTVTATPPSSTYIPQQGDSDSQIASFLLELDEDCLSPCWWGFEMGVTPARDWVDFIVNFAPNSWTSYGKEITSFEAFGNDIENAGFAYYINTVRRNNTVVRLVQFYPIFWDFDENEEQKSYIQIDEVFQQYGVPDQIMFSYHDPGSGFIVEVQYLHKGIILEYRYRLLDVVNSNDDQVTFCPNQNKPYRLHIYAVPSGTLIPENIPMAPSPHTGAIDQITPFTPETFSEAFLQNSEFCLDIPFEGWLSYP